MEMFWLYLGADRGFEIHFGTYSENPFRRLPEIDFGTLGRASLLR